MMEEWMETLERDLLYAARQLWSARGLSLLAILTLALGIGSNAALFTVVDDVLVRPLPYAHADRLTSINPRTQTPSIGETSWLNYLDLKQGTQQTFSDMAGYAVDLAVIEGGTRAVEVAAPRVTTNLIPMLGAHPLLGRGFDKADGLSGGPKVVLLSEDLWRNTFHADPHILGRVVKVSGVPRTVVGVLPASFRFPAEMGSQAKNELFLPLQPTPVMLSGRGYTFFNVLGVLRPAVTTGEAQGEVDAVTQRILKVGGDSTTGLAYTVSSYQSLVTGSVRPALDAMLAALGLVLLIACANVANMLIARFLGRKQEFAVRVALGASRQRLVGQLLTEGALLSAAGCLCGLVLAECALALVNKLPPDTLPVQGAITLHWQVLLAVAAIGTLTTILSSLMPALLAARTNPQTALQATSRGLGSGAGASRISPWLVIVEVMLSTLLLMGTGLLVHTLWNLTHADLGFNVEHVTGFQAFPANAPGFSGSSMPSAAAAPSAVTAQDYENALEHIRHAPGVENAALISMPPFSGVHFGADGIDIAGRPHSNAKRVSALLSAVSGDYGRTMGIPVLSGRMISEQDGAGAPLVTVVNQAFAKRYFPDADPLQHQLIIGGKDTGTPQPYTIVGVIPDQPDQSLNDAIQPEILLPYRQISTSSLFYGMLLRNIVTFVVKTHGDIPVANEMRTIFRQNAPGYALDSFETMQQTVNDSMASQRLSLYVTAAFAGLAIVMLVSGLYGVLAQLVGYRRREIGIRMALGASRRAMARMIVRQGLMLIAIGLAAGLCASILLGRLLQSFLFGVRVLDAWTFAGVIVTALVVGVAASLVPAYRASSVEPMESLREG
jgi:putative ABC transport system permease protein